MLNQTRLNPTAPDPIVVEHLVKRFKDFTAVDDVSFRVRAGEIFGWLGPNGAGKTTTIRILLGLLRPTSGRAEVLGFDTARNAKSVHARVGYMSQQFTLYNDLTPLENIRLYGMIQGLSNNDLRQRQQEIIQMAGLAGHERQLTGTLSGGWKQRLALGCAIVHRPQVVFLDEPTAGVDPISRREFWELIYAMAAEGVTILVTTHYMDEAELCQRVGFISQGRLVAIDTPEQLKRTAMRGQVLEITCAEPNRALQILKAAQQNGALQLEEVALYGAQIHAVTAQQEVAAAQEVAAQEVPAPVAKKASAGEQTTPEMLRAVLENAGIAVAHIDRIAPTLEDVFISTVR